MDSFEHLGSAGADYVDTGFASLAAVAKRLQDITLEATAYSRRTAAAGSAALEELASAGSLESACEIQARHAKAAYEALVAEATRMSGLYADLARDAYKPFEQAATGAR
jgi:hypothetical protein